MNELQVFSNSEFGELSILVIDGKEHFPATECAAKLGYSNPHDAILRHCKGVVKREVLTEGGMQEINFIPEGDLYRLIARSKLPSAERFEHWVFDEVIPAIRKTGAYVPAPASLEDLIIMQAQSVKELKAKVQLIEANAIEARAQADTATQQIQAVKEAIITTDKDWRRDINKKLQRIGFQTGDYQGTKHESYDLLEKRGHCNLERRLENLRNRMREAGSTRTQINNANYLDVIEAEPRLKEIYGSIIRELTIKHVA